VTYQTGWFATSGIEAQGWVSKLIKFGARVAGYPEYARHYSHAFLFVSEHGDIVEAVKRGVRPAHVSKYKPEDLTIYRVPVDPHDQAQIQEFAKSVVDAHYSYGYWSFVACGFNCLFAPLKWVPFSFSVAHTKICSAFVADALTRAGLIFDKSVEVVMPADLAVQFHDYAS
jgi:hypothetical protein